MCWCCEEDWWDLHDDDPSPYSTPGVSSYLVTEDGGVYPIITLNPGGNTGGIGYEAPWTGEDAEDLPGDGI